jgi:AraC-like DNA-binding protein
MLTYLGTGQRWYGEKPVKALQRRSWEFQSVLTGAIAPIFAQGPDLLHRRTMWLFPTGHMHGWTGEEGAGAEVVVFQFLTVPEPLRRLFRTTGDHLQLALSEAQCRRLRELSRNARRYWDRPAAGMMLCYEHILLELSMLMYESSVGKGTANRREEDAASKKVNQALAWFNAHMEENPGMETLARAVAVSCSHLRRLFHDVLQASPKQMLDQMRFQRAQQLMAEPGVKLSAVGEACGFGSPSAFSRAFKAKFGVSPERWRE